MSNRLADTFTRLRREKHVGLVAFATAGDPNLDRSAAVFRGLDRGGADVLEIGVPFSDPLADGPVIQRASERALAAGTTLHASLDLVERLRPHVAAPVVLFTYANPLLRMRIDCFIDRARGAGTDGVLVVDLPIEEAGDLHQRLDAAGIDMIFLVSPTTSTERLRKAAALGRGFLYGISRLGVTGAREALAQDARDLAARIRAVTSLPLALGFGISRPEHVRDVGEYADAAVVGSALVNVVADGGTAQELGSRVEAYVRWLKGDQLR